MQGPFWPVGYLGVTSPSGIRLGSLPAWWALRLCSGAAVEVVFFSPRCKVLCPGEAIQWDSRPSSGFFWEQKLGYI